MSDSLTETFSERNSPERIINGGKVPTRSVSASLPKSVYDTVKAVADKRHIDIQALICSALNKELRAEGYPEFQIERAKAGRPKKEIA